MLFHRVRLDTLDWELGASSGVERERGEHPELFIEFHFIKIMVAQAKKYHPCYLLEFELIKNINRKRLLITCNSQHAGARYRNYGFLTHTAKVREEFENFEKCLAMLGMIDEEESTRRVTFLFSC